MRMSTHVNNTGVARLSLEGELDAQVKESLLSSLSELLRASTNTCVIVELDDVTFMDSGGIGALVEGYRQADAAGKGYQVLGATGMVQRVLEITGVAGLLADGIEQRS